MSGGQIAFSFLRPTDGFATRCLASIFNTIKWIHLKEKQNSNVAIADVVKPRLVL